MPTETIGYKPIEFNKLPLTRIEIQINKRFSAFKPADGFTSEEIQILNLV